MKPYKHAAIEKKWQAVWEKKQPWKASARPGKKRFYGLIEFPYPSGAGLHVGHIRSNTAMDIIARKHRMRGYDVLYPIGWDAFGLPTENYAIKTGIHPKKVTKQNTDTFREQLKKIGFSFDWSREVDTTDPEYYKWTQWIFLQLYKKGLAYKAKMPINWCLSCKIGLANEEVVDGTCERCGGAVEQRVKEQWMLAITKYADRLYDDLDTVDFIDAVKTQQRNWIGRSEGAEIAFPLQIGNRRADSITVFTTRADTLYGATFLVLAPEHPWVSTIAATDAVLGNAAEVRAYIDATKRKSDLERQENKEKTGVCLQGVDALNPATGQPIPVFIADYVLPHYGTGAIMAVPAHDERDFEFAKKFNLAIKNVISPASITVAASGPMGVHIDMTAMVATKEASILSGREVYGGEGTLRNSAEFNDLSTKEARVRITSLFGNAKRTYKLRDWVFSRQRYWGEPIPMIRCESCGWVPVPEKDLPVKLPTVKNYEPTDTGESPLSAISSWVKVKCPQCKKPARRETDTMPNWAGSSWYFLRYADPKNKKALASKEALKSWTPIDWYNGGMEHTTLHLLYSRFWHKFLYDIKVVPTKEPYKKRTSHGMILAENGVKMSKSKGNVINPDDIVKLYGADTLRVYEMFMGPFSEAIAWNTQGMIGVRRFLERVWKLGQPESERGEPKVFKALEPSLHALIKKVSEDIDAMKFNTAIAAMMSFLNEAEKEGISRAQFDIFLTLLAPFAPHITEELWQLRGRKGSVHAEKWPKWSDKKLVRATVTIAVQINGKLRATIIAPTDIDEHAALVAAKAQESVAKYLDGMTIRRVIYVPGRLLNIVL